MCSSDLVGSQQSTIKQTDSGWHTHCFSLNETLTQITMEITWHESASSSTWINPSGFSGRGDRILDTTGIRLHWLEIMFDCPINRRHQNRRYNVTDNEESHSDASHFR